MVTLTLGEALETRTAYSISKFGILESSSTSSFSCISCRASSAASLKMCASGNFEFSRCPVKAAEGVRIVLVYKRLGCAPAHNPPLALCKRDPMPRRDFNIAVLPSFAASKKCRKSGQTPFQTQGRRKGRGVDAMNSNPSTAFPRFVILLLVV